jgi:hypothetical protein
MMEGGGEAGSKVQEVLAYCFPMRLPDDMSMSMLAYHVSMNDF